LEQVIDNLYVGSDDDYEKLKSKPGWSCLRCCKEGPGGHRDTLQYTTQAAPKGDDYLAAKKGDRMALNFIDANDPNFVPLKMIESGLRFIDQRIKAGDKILVACNAGHSRGPTVAMLYLRATGELPGNFNSSERIYRTLYREYDPGIGVRQFARSHWHTFENFLRK
jgi:protein-tyrosine phosphatase